MARYYFHVKRGQVTVLDHEGVELSDVKDAVEEATRRAKETISREPDAASGAIVIADDWQTVQEVPFGERA